MEELEVTWERALTVWWSVAWRSGLFGFLAALAIGLVITFFGGALHLNPQFIQRLLRLVGIVVGAGAAVWSVKHVLAKKFKDFRIVLRPLD
ncbi:MAG: hypothetical protein ABSE08_14960 [Syntrophobacteraceae bacterium]|jgi:uncharacterized membrane protein